MIKEAYLQVSNNYILGVVSAPSTYDGELLFRPGNKNENDIIRLSSGENMSDGFFKVLAYYPLKQTPYDNILFENVPRFSDDFYNALKKYGFKSTNVDCGYAIIEDGSVLKQNGKVKIFYDESDAKKYISDSQNIILYPRVNDKNIVIKTNKPSDFVAKSRVRKFLNSLSKAEKLKFYI
jgi:hypothetical protein